MPPLAIAGYICTFPKIWVLILVRFLKAGEVDSVRKALLEGTATIPFLFLGLLFLVVSCQEDITTDETVVVPEEVLFVGGDKVRLSGRLIANRTVNVEEHGFEISLDESFSNPTVITLGTRSTPGRFLGEVAGLQNSTDYFWRPFVTINGGMTFGSNSVFTTQTPGVNSFSPNIGFPGQVVQIEGKNFSEGLQVFFGSAPANVLEIKSDALVRVSIPEIQDSQFVDITLQVQDDVFTLDGQFEYVVGLWEEAGEFVEPFSAFGPFDFQTEDEFVIGLGLADTKENFKIWKLDFASWAWSEIPFFGTSTRFAFAADSYFGGGQLDGFPPLGSFDFWTYDKAGNQFIQRNPLPSGLVNAIALNINGESYLFGGEIGVGPSNFSVYKYDDTADLWTVIGGSDVELSANYPAFSFGIYGYFIDQVGLLYRYNSLDGTWIIMNQYPSGMEPGMMAEKIGSKVYIGASESRRAVYEYDIPSNNWKPKNGFPGLVFVETIATWNHDGVIYLMKNVENSSGEAMSIWSFKPNEF